MALLRNSLVGGTIAGLATSAWLLLCGERKGSILAPMNAVSHIAFGDDAYDHEEPSVKHTPTGFLLNMSATATWALIHELIFGRRGRPHIPEALATGAAVSALAYAVDYHAVPERLKPGFEKKVSKGGLAGVYVVLALGLAAGAVLRER